MLKPSLDYIRASKPLNLLFWIAVTVFLGALGSGLWETMVSPLFSWSGRQLLRFLTYISQAYSDSLHSRIGVDGMHSLGLLPHKFSFFAIMFAPWTLVFACDFLVKKAANHLPKQSQTVSGGETIEEIYEELQKIHRIAAHLRTFCIWFAVISCVFNFHAQTTAMYSYTASRFVERSIEILSPSLSEAERLRFRAQYRAIETADDFARLYDALNVASINHKAKIPKFSPILRRSGA